MVERQPSKLNVAGSNPVSRSRAVHKSRRHRAEQYAHLAQLVERVLGKDEVTSSILVVGSKKPVEATRAHERYRKVRERWPKKNSYATSLT